MRFWRGNAREREWDARYLVRVRKEAWDRGQADLVSVERGGAADDEARETALGVDRIGEVLVQLYVGLVTLDEVTETTVDG